MPVGGDEQSGQRRDAARVVAVESVAVSGDHRVGRAAIVRAAESCGS